METAARNNSEIAQVPFSLAAGGTFLVPERQVVLSIYPSKYRKKVIIEEDCWLWQGTLKNGYGRIRTNGIGRGAHKFFYEFVFGEVLKGLVLDHLCRVRHCVNPNHLEAVTARENLLRGVGAAAKNAQKTHCIRGHELSGDNLKKTKNGVRICRLCNILLQRKYNNKAEESCKTK